VIRDYKHPISFQKKFLKIFLGWDCRNRHYEYYMDLCFCHYHFKHLYTVTMHENTRKCFHWLGASSIYMCFLHVFAPNRGKCSYEKTFFNYIYIYYIYIPHFLYQFISWLIICFHCLAVMNIASINIGMQTFLWHIEFISFGYITGSETDVSYMVVLFKVFEVSPYCLP
jgi:hypothetical protein